MIENFLTVSELVKDIKNIVESQFGFVVIKGEVSNIHTSFSGHTYFTLKDKESQIKCALFKFQKKAVEKELVEDHEFIVWGKISLYEAKAELTLIVSFYMPFGEGAEALKLKMLKESLHKRGVFNQKHKKPLPEICEKIGVVTSAGGAAIHDIIRVARNRFPALKIVFYPAMVQGEKGESTIVKAIEELSKIDSIDAIIVGRGGGSKEDLNVFNSEKIALAVINSPKPIIAAVGHEIDKTIIDLAASFSVSTPSAAAELVTRDVKSLISQINQNITISYDKITSKIRHLFLKLDHLTASLPSPLHLIKERIYRIDLIMRNAEKKVYTNLEKSKTIFYELNTKLEISSPLRPLENGYVLIKQNSKIVKRKQNFSLEKPFSIKFIDGEVEVKNRKNSLE